MRYYLIGILLLGGLAPMWLASHLHGRWIEPIRPRVPTLAPYLVIMAGLVGIGLAVDGPHLFADGRWPGLAVSPLLGYVISRLSWRADRWILTRLTRRGEHTPPPARLRPARGTVRPVGIAADKGTLDGPAPGQATGRWTRLERTRDTHLGPAWLIGGAVLEELLYRGAWGRLALDAALLSATIALLTVATLAFTVLHLPFGWAHVVAKLPLSLAALAATLISGSILAAAIGHAWFNLRVWKHYRSVFGGQKRRTGR
ncbi:CPBP family intramembrane metalloprotease [Streptomyces sp. RB6PN25]|uniref:CPBP family intramembrane metalloprotease n=1 Tax=Streptomyces humicola TaxID=2953240 RepID=A0ABT1PSV5_9ACTN|nr:CPBP family intramembrane glutamic endopeptidase [Streptomyces humicola]MCQ4080758.1 CPBP family intramembrane metalloprotease [Streptomyces humicola]